ncbi:hypothetical protein NC653_028847 [Populus alba x Populus x berolinensis]|uniref:Uncharacterized protein n=1 Tax=Populus alba x Populus x berolinensis TaxID=444605 RepID=A0AAD6M0Q9_9ROSI|nr:hypothetical protein NC653_028847 [Populus alba x Populus x berolinensis]
MAGRWVSKAPSRPSFIIDTSNQNGFKGLDSELKMHVKVKGICNNLFSCTNYITWIKLIYPPTSNYPICYYLIIIPTDEAQFPRVLISFETEKSKRQADWLSLDRFFVDGYAVVCGFISNRFNGRFFSLSRERGENCKGRWVAVVDYQEPEVYSTDEIADLLIMAWTSLGRNSRPCLQAIYSVLLLLFSNRKDRKQELWPLLHRGIHSFSLLSGFMLTDCAIKHTTLYSAAHVQTRLDSASPSCLVHSVHYVHPSFCFLCVVLTFKPS